MSLLRISSKDLLRHSDVLKQSMQDAFRPCPEHAHATGMEYPQLQHYGAGAL